MSSKEMCAIVECQRSCHGSCDCCKQDLCLHHLNEHNQLLVFQLNPLIDDISRLTDQINRIISQNLIMSDEQHQKYDHFIFMKIGEHKQSIENLDMKLSQFIHDEETTKYDIDTIHSTINILQENLNKIEQIYFEINNNRTTIDENIMQLRKLSIQEMNTSIFCRIYKTIKPPNESYRGLASNGQFLLIHQRPYLCLLDTELRIVKYVRWPHGIIHDINWSTVLKQFIVITTNIIYGINPNTMFINTLIKNNNQRHWSSACSNNRLFVSTNSWGSSIIEIALLPQIKIIKNWQSSAICSADEFIDDTFCDDKTWFANSK